MNYKTFGTFLVSASLVIALVSFTGINNQLTGGEKAPAISAKHIVKYMADVESTEITWKGKKVGAEHTGTIALKSGVMLNDHGRITGGTFIIDMTSLKNTDIEKEDMSAKLEGHLHSEDFFNTSEYPEAMLKVKNISPADGSEGGSHVVIADLTIKGITNAVEIPANISFENNTMFIMAEFSIDRTKWKVHYGSKTIFESIGDKFIYDDIMFTVKTKLTAGRH